MKFLQFIRFVVIMILSTAFASKSHAQCTTTNILTQDFNTAGVSGFNTGATGTAAGNETKGAYASLCTALDFLTNDAQSYDGTDVWRANLTVSPGKLPTGHDNGTSSDYALLIDGCKGASPPYANYWDTTVWCVNVTVAAGEIYNMSAWLTTPWLQTKGNDPDVYFTINGKQVGAAYTLDLWNAATNSPNPYRQDACFYTIPAGTSGVVPFCITLKERTGGTDAVIGSGSFGMDNQGNDILIDDIQITKYAGAGCGTTTGCTLTPLPVQLISFDLVRVANGEVSLNWSAIADAEASYFSLEKSTNAKDFVEFGTVKVRTSNDAEYYSFSDNNFDQTSYYRIKSIDKNGSYSYSDVKVAESGTNFINVFRNASGEFELKALMKNADDVTLNVYSILGVELVSEQLSLTPGENTVRVAGLPTDENSTKIVRVIGADGNVLLSKVLF